MKREIIAITLLLALVGVAAVIIVRQNQQQKQLQQQLAQASTPNADRIGNAVGNLASRVLGIWVK